MNRDRAKQVESDAFWSLKKGFKWLVILAVAFTALWFVFGLIGLFTLPFRTASGVLERTFDADNVIAEYELFRDRYQQILAMDAQHEDARQSADDYLALIGGTAGNLLESREYGRRDTLAVGIRNRQNELIGRYNADASKANVQIFQNPELFGLQFGSQIPERITFR